MYRSCLTGYSVTIVTLRQRNTLQFQISTIPSRNVCSSETIIKKELKSYTCKDIMLIRLTYRYRIVENKNYDLTSGNGWLSLLEEGKVFLINCWASSLAAAKTRRPKNWTCCAFPRNNKWNHCEIKLREIYICIDVSVPIPTQQSCACMSHIFSTECTGQIIIPQHSQCNIHPLPNLTVEVILMETLDCLKINLTLRKEWS